MSEALHLIANSRKKRFRKTAWRAAAAGAVIPISVVLILQIFRSYPEPLALQFISLGIWPLAFGFGVATEQLVPFSFDYMVILLVATLVNAILYVSIATLATLTYSRFKYAAIIVYFFACILGVVSFRSATFLIQNWT